MEKEKKSARKPRADGLRNHRRLIAAAKEVLGHGGPEASLEAVAHRAGLGVGTLYRHFPTREALFYAVYRREVEHLIDLAGELEKSGDPVEGLRVWLAANVSLVATKRGLLGAQSPVLTAESKAVFAELSASLTAAVRKLLNRAVAAGALRPDIPAEDLLHALYALCYARQPEKGWEKHVLRLLGVFVDGLLAR